MKRLLSCISIATLLVGFLISGCSRVPPPLKPPTGAGATNRSTHDVFREFVSIVRFPDNPRPGDDWTRFREGINQLAPHFSNSDVRLRVRLTPEDRAFLENEVHLSDTEISDVAATSFRTADGHYLDECFLLRDAARSHDVQGFTAAKQAELLFDWTMRNVMLFEQGDTWIPPAFTLRRGFGSPVERAMVLLALLRQSQVDGCLIVVPDTKPLQFVVGVLDAKAKAMLLFDTCLGLPLRNKDGKVLTLAEAKADPKLLQPAQITSEDAKKLEAWLVCPFYALAPRMLELQNTLARLGDPVTLYLDARGLKQQIAAVTGLAAKVWNAPADKGAMPNSPTRCLRLFIPKSEGGLDETHRADLWARWRVPVQNIEANLAQINLTRELLLPDAFGMFPGVTPLLFEKYDSQVREMYLRGQYDPLIRRQDRLHGFVDESLAGLAQDTKFREQVTVWRETVNRAIAAGDKNTLQSQLGLDEFMMRLLEGFLVRPEGQTDPLRMLRHQIEQANQAGQQRKTEAKPELITQIFAVGMRDYFDMELARTQAMISQERASVIPDRDAKKMGQAAWETAYRSWSNGYVRRIDLADLLTRRLAQLRAQRDYETRVGLLETLHLDVHKYVQARLCMADCAFHLADKAKARTDLEETRRIVEEMQKQGQLLAEVKAVREPTQAMPPPLRSFFRRRLDLLANDWSADGHYAWIIRTMDVQLAAQAPP